MPVYQIAIVKVENRTPTFADYVTKAAELSARYGGEYMVRGPAESVVEGDYLKGRAVVVSRWPSLERAKEFWNSDEYQKQIKPLRDGAGVFDIALYEAAK